MNSEDTLNESFINEARVGYDFSMENMLYEQALFFARAIQAESDYSLESAVLTGKALYMSGQTERAIEVLQPFAIYAERATTAQSKQVVDHVAERGVLLYARCCYDLERFGDAISVLYPVARVQGMRATSAFSLERLEAVVSGAPGLLLLGKSLEKIGDRNGAAECFSKCLNVNPLMFEAFERLSELSFDNPKVAIPPSRFAKTFFNDQTVRSEPVKIALPAVPPSVITGTPIKTRQGARGGIPMTPRRGLSPPSVSKPSRAQNTSSGSFCQYLQTVGAAIHALNGHDTNVVVDTVSKLAGHHQESVLVKSLLGKSLVDAGRFVEAESVFSSALKQSPAGVVEYIDLYSSVLWQLKKETELAHLCTHGLRVANRSKCAKLWIAVGNSFSLQKEPETAMKFINRAIQIDPHCAYAHTLMGHEFFAQDKFDRAKQCYTRALEADPRNYHAFWGLGQIHARQEEFPNAKFNFIKALEINPKSSTVRYALASVALALRENELAYQQLSLAVELNAGNAPALCQKGLLEMTVLRRMDLARETLEKALSVAPNEPVVFVLLGRILASAGGLREEAMACFNNALELLKGSKDTLGIKQAIEELDILAT